MRESFRSKGKVMSSQQHGPVSHSKPRASGIFSNAIRSKLISKLPNGKVLMESPNKDLHHAAKKASLSGHETKAILSKSVSLSKLNMLTKNRPNHHNRKTQIRSYQDGAFEVVARAKLIEIVDKLRFLGDGTKTPKLDCLSSTPLRLSQSFTRKSLTKTPQSLRTSNGSGKTPQDLTETQSRNLVGSNTTPCLRKTFQTPSANIGATPHDISKLMRDAASIPFLSAPRDINFSEAAYSPSGNFQAQISSSETITIETPIPSAQKGFDSESQYSISLQKFNEFRWQPRSPDDCWQHSILF